MKNKNVCLHTIITARTLALVQWPASSSYSTAVSYLTLRVGWQRGDPPLCVPMSNTTDAESDTDIIYRVDCCGVQFELVPARCFFAPSPHHPRRQSLGMKTDRPQLASGQSRIVDCADRSILATIIQASAAY